MFGEIVSLGWDILSLGCLWLNQEKKSGRQFSEISLS